jgi:amidase/aspartyl-tRNA(Asn)/glutamyl-tRNA(Gln) amidotransferase subunit A
MSLTRPAQADLCAARESILQGRISARDALEQALHAAEGPAARHAFVRRFDDTARAAADAVDTLRRAGTPAPALAGLAVSVKDLFDVGGAVTTAGSVVLTEAPAATADAPAVARLRRAGAAIVGHTNMTEFAFSGVGINPHWGTPANAATAALDHEPRIPGGSTSGGAVSVAAGAAWAALGSDTGGSIRIPAALHGLVGFKCTQRLVPLAGSVPLSTTLDTACAITRSVRDARLVHEVIAARSSILRDRPLSALRLAVPQAVMLDDLEPAVASCFERALSRLAAAGARIESIELPLLRELSSLNAKGGFSAAEAWHWHRELIARDGARYDPRVAVRIRRGEAMGAADYIELLQARRRWIDDMQAALRGFDAMLSPTTPLVAPRIADLAEDGAFFATNARLLRNPSAVNFLDGCAISLPCHAPGEMPVGLMAWGPAMTDDTILEVSLAIETALATGGH